MEHKAETTTEEITTDKRSELKKVVQNLSKIGVDERELHCQVEDQENELKVECGESGTESNVAAKQQLMK